MFPIDKKKTAMIILSKMNDSGKEKSQEVENEESMSEDYAEYHAIAEDMLQAISDKSVIDLAKVLEAFHEIIKHEDMEQDKAEE